MISPTSPLRVLLLPTLLLVAGLSGSLQAAGNSLSNGLAAYYPFAGNGNDASGQGRNLVLTNAAFATGVRGQDLSAGWASLSTNVTNLSTGDFSYSGWVNLNTLNRGQGSEWMYLLGGYYTGTAGLRICVNPSDPSYRQVWFGYGYLTPGYWFGSQQVSSIQTNQWIHLAATMGSDKKGTVASIYLNGALLTSRSNLPRIPIDYGNFTLGNDGGGNNYPLDGQMDEVRFYNRTLSAAEVANLYNLDRQKVLVYGVAGKGTTATSTGVQNVTSSGYFLADPASQRTAFLWLGTNKSYTIESHDDIDLQTTGLLDGSTSLYSLAIASGPFPKVEKDTFWVSGVNATLALDKATVVCVAPKLTGTLNTLTLQGGTAIESQAATLTLDKASTLTAVAGRETLSSALTRISNVLKAQGYTPAPTPTPVPTPNPSPTPPPLTSPTTDTFGTGSNQFTIDFVGIGNLGNSNDTTGFGGVPYAYRIGKYTISQNQIDAAVRNGLQHVTAGAWRGDQPAANITWYEAAAYVNWLNTSQGHAPAYNLTWTNGAWSMALWPTTPDINGNVAWTNGGTNLYRNANCVYFLPSENEWYKAAYYDPNKQGGSGGYWLYPTGSDSDPIAIASGTASGTAIYLQPFGTGPASVFQAGGLTFYGTSQAGNVWHWEESAWDNNNDITTESRGLRGGYWSDNAVYLQSSVRISISPDFENTNIGFRVASKGVAIPPPITSPTTDTFGTGSNQFTIDFVGIGNPGNSNDTTGYGEVPYSYRIGKYTISRNQFDKAVRNGLQNVSADASGGDQPAAWISWYEAATYVNWLNTSQGYRPAYNFTLTNGSWSMALWPTTPDSNGNVAWTSGGTNLYRNANCVYFLPSENEWYKAAYYDPAKNGGAGGYWLYPTGSDTAPTPVASGTAAGTAVYSLSWRGIGFASVFDSGGLSPYGTMGQGGNIFQWLETSRDGLNNDPQKARCFRGGYCYDGLPNYLQSLVRNYHFGSDYGPGDEVYGYIGIRVARKP